MQDFQHWGNRDSPPSSDWNWAKNGTSVANSTANKSIMSVVMSHGPASMSDRRCMGTYTRRHVHREQWDREHMHSRMEAGRHIHGRGEQWDRSTSTHQWMRGDTFMDAENNGTEAHALTDGGRPAQSPSARCIAREEPTMSRPVQGLACQVM